MSKIAGDINKHMMRDSHARAINQPALELIADILEKHTNGVLAGAREHIEQRKSRRKADEALLLADALEQQFPIGTAQHYLDGEAAAELRRLHTENEGQAERIQDIYRQLNDTEKEVDDLRLLLRQALEALNHVNVQDRVQIITAIKERLK